MSDLTPFQNENNRHNGTSENLPPVPGVKKVPRKGKGQISSRLGLVAAMAACSVIALGISAPTVAVADTAYNLDIPAQDLGSALKALGAAADQQVLFSEKVVVGLKSPPLSGELTVEQALAQMLAGSGLAADRTPSGVLLIRTAKASEHPKPTADVSAAASRSFRLAQSDPTAQQSDSSSATPANETLDTLQEIVVTGSRLTTTGLNTPAPVTVLSAENLRATGLTSIGEVLRDQPLSGALGATDTAGRGNTGLATVALRGLGPVNTLVLMNSRRLLSANAGGQVDLNSIPFNAIERVEILQDGASAVYGSDAIAGVVNLIMKDHQDGLSLDGYFGRSTYSDANVTDLSLTFGSEFDRGSFLFAASHREQDGYLISSRPCCRDADQRAQGGANLRDPLPVPASVVGVPGTTGEQIIKEGVTQATTSNDFRPFVNNFFGAPAPDDAFNYYDYESSMSDLTVNNIWFNGHRELGAGITGFVEVAWNQRKSVGFLAPDAFGAVYGDPIIVSATNDFNPFGVDLSVARTIIEQGRGGGRTQDVDSETRRLIAGLKGNIGDPSAGWHWEISYNVQRLGEFDFNGNVTSRTRLKQAAGDSAACLAAGNGCVPINLLGAAGTITDPMLGFILVPTFTDRDSTLDSTQLNLSGRAFSMPAGDVQLAFGAEYRKESFDLINDSFRNSGDIIFNVTTVDAHPPTRKISEAYLETSLPLLSSLDLDLAVRYSDYNQFGNTTNPKFGLRWRPVAGVLLRASYGTGFRAPTFTEAFGGQASGFRSVVDPCQGADFASLPGCGGVQAPAGLGSFVVTGGNPNLDPETAKNYSAGIVWTPAFISGLSASLDAFRIQKEDLIAAADVNYIIDRNARFGDFANLVVRDSANRLQQVFANLNNIGTDKVQGADLSVKYHFQTEAMGSFDTGFNLAYVDEFSRSLAIGTPATDRVGTYETALGTIAKIRFTTQARWDHGKWSLNYLNRYIGSVDNVNGYVSARQKVDAYLQHDLAFTYRLEALGSVTPLTLGIENVFNEKPPFVDGNFQNNFDTGTFNSRGRFYYLRAIFNL